ncbi:MAG: hypothetical protein CL610_27070 [Anaerolineaceae bacterium]|nr:hypothetical protein [Anaerolineaceae bacterium]
MKHFDYCPHRDACKVCQFFEQYAVKTVINAYCQGDYQTCQRYQYREAGQPIPDNLLPAGFQVEAVD